MESSQSFAISRKSDGQGPVFSIKMTSDFLIALNSKQQATENYIEFQTYGKLY